MENEFVTDYMKEQQEKNKKQAIIFWVSALYILNAGSALFLIFGWKMVAIVSVVISLVLFILGMVKYHIAN